MDSLSCRDILYVSVTSLDFPEQLKRKVTCANRTCNISQFTVNPRHSWGTAVTSFIWTTGLVMS